MFLEIHIFKCYYCSFEGVPIVPALVSLAGLDYYGEKRL